MMIIKKTAFACKCDNCGRHWIDEYAGNIGFSDELGMHQIVTRDSSWLVRENKHYCPDCWNMDASGNAVPGRISRKIQKRPRLGVFARLLLLAGIFLHRS